jgi:predicted nucleic acid-binding protein
MKLYLDVCCWNRPFDDQSQNRVRLEAEAVLSILEMAQADEIEIVSSDTIGDELSKMPDRERREKVELLLALASARMALTPAIEERAVELQTQNISSFDALHLASAESARSDYFLTTDDDLLRKAKRAGLKVKVENPAKWLIQETTDEN